MEPTKDGSTLLFSWGFCVIQNNQFQQIEKRVTSGAE